MEKIDLKYLDKEINNLKIHERYNELTDFGKEKLKSFIEIRKQLSIAVVVVSEAELCDNPHCEDGIVDRDMYGHPIYCQVCDKHN